MASGDTVGGVGHFSVSGFVVRRVVALGYLSAFLSLVVQVDGLFGCGGLFPMNKLVFALFSFVVHFGASLAGLAFLGAKVCERRAFLTFALLWAAFAGCMWAAPALYPQLEDKMLLEAGLVTLFISAGGDNPSAVLAREMGRALGTWLLFRCLFAAGAQKVCGTCSAWRELAAMKDIYQIEVFPTPVAFGFYHNFPPMLCQALTCLQLYVELMLPPLLLTPWRWISMPTAKVQILFLVAQMVYTNRGYLPVCMAALALAHMDDASHRTMWSEWLLSSWGCAHIGDGENGDDEQEEDKKKSKHAKKDVATPKNQPIRRAQPREAPIAMLTIFACYLVVAVIALSVCIPDEVIMDGSNPIDADTIDGPGQMWFLILALAAAAAAGGLAVMLGSAIQSAVMGFGTTDMSSAGHVILVVMAGLVMCMGGFLQLGNDLSNANASSLPAPLGAAANIFEHMHVSHALGNAAESLLCPNVEGRADIVLQGAHVLPPHVPNPESEEEKGSPNSRVHWVTVSSRSLPGGITGGISTNENRPYFQFLYRPRIDLLLWQTAQKTHNEKQEPADFMFRFARSLAYRKGGAARLAAGPWSGPVANVLYHDISTSDYAKLTTPIPVIRIVWYRHRFTLDTFNNKWFDRTAAKVLRQIGLDEIEQIP